MSNINPNCCGDKCTVRNGEVRWYPLGGGANLILCHACFANENKYRFNMGKLYGRPDWPQVNWTTAKHCEEEG